MEIGRGPFGGLRLDVPPINEVFSHAVEFGRGPFGGLRHLASRLVDDGRRGWVEIGRGPLYIGSMRRDNQSSGDRDTDLSDSSRPTSDSSVVEIGSGPFGGLRQVPQSLRLSCASGWNSDVDPSGDYEMQRERPSWTPLPDAAMGGVCREVFLEPQRVNSRRRMDGGDASGLGQRSSRTRPATPNPFRRP